MHRPPDVPRLERSRETASVSRARRWVAVCAAALCVGAWLGGPSGAAAQQDGPRVYIVSVPMEEGLGAVATRAGSAARGALRGIEGVNWQGPDQLFLGYDDSALSVLSRARQALDDGRAAYLQLELDQAIERLTAAVDAFDAAAAALEDPQDLGQALLFLGASYGFNQQQREARTVFARLHRQMPHIQPDPDTFPPDVVSLYQASRPRDASRPSGIVSIDSNPQGAIAYVDFLARGRTPLNVEELVAGEHVVRVTRPGATPFVEALSVRRGRASTSNAYLVDSPELEGLSDLIDQVPDASIDSIDEGPIREIATRLELDKIGVIRVSGSGDQVSLELLLFDVESGRRLVRGEGSAPTTIGVLESSVQRAVTGAFEAALRTASQAGDEEEAPALSNNTFDNDTGPTDDGPSRPVTEEWWFWTIIGVVAAAGIAAAIAIPLATQGPPLGEDPGGQVILTF